MGMLHSFFYNPRKRPSFFHVNDEIRTGPWFMSDRVGKTVSFFNDSGGRWWLTIHGVDLCDTPSIEL